MGESKGGREEAARPTTDRLLRQLVAEYSGEGKEVRSIYVQRVRTNVYRYTVFLHGEQEPLETFILEDGEGNPTASLTPSGGNISSDKPPKVRKP